MIVIVYDKKGTNAIEKTKEILDNLTFSKIEKYVIHTRRNYDERKSALDINLSDSNIAIGIAIINGLKIANSEDEKKTIFYGYDFFNEEIEKEINKPNFIEKIINKDGLYVVTSLYKNKLVVYRDSIGLAPFYFHQNDRYLIISPQIKSFWIFGIKSPISFPPGRIFFYNKKFYRTSERKIYPLKHKIKDMNFHAIELSKEIEEIISKIVENEKNIAIAFSGGLDSSIIAYVLSKYTNVIGYNIGFNEFGEKWMNIAEDIAEQIGIKLIKLKVSMEDVKNELEKFITCIEEKKELSIEIGLPIYFLAKKISEDNFKKSFFGQGADEIFGGYKRYSILASSNKYKLLEEEMLKDVLELYSTNLERDCKILMNFGIVPIYPYLCKKIIEYTIGLPIYFKLNRSGERKIILKRIGEKIGLPKNILGIEKKAIQYSSGSSKAIKMIKKERKEIINTIYNNIFKKFYKENYK
ncbi:MAG: asparagine synthase-related protein [Nitrososphaerota archaeon]